MTPEERARIADDQRRINTEAIVKGAAENPMRTLGSAGHAAVRPNARQAISNDSSAENMEPEPLRRRGPAGASASRH